MNEIQAHDVAALIEKHSSIVNFGSKKNSPTDEWILKAEASLRRALPKSYKWFLREYGGGEVGGEEIYSIYGLPFESVNGGDIVFQHIINQRSDLLDDSKLVICETDFGEVFFFDYKSSNETEPAIYVRLPSGECKSYANNFYEFLAKRIEAHS